MSEADRLKIREIFSILTQGVELVQYEVNTQTNKSTVDGRILWMDSELYRICVHTTRPAVVDHKSGNIPPGLYLRDIGEIRPGVNSYHFEMNKMSTPKEANNCLSLIGSERTISIEFPTSFSRDWFLVRLQSLIDDVKSSEDANQVYSLYRSDLNANKLDVGKIYQFRELLLKRGIQMQAHTRSGQIRKAVMSFDAEKLELLLLVESPQFLNSRKAEVLTLKLNDVSELRKGSHSFGFVNTNSTNLYDKTLSIISTQNVFDIEFISKETRDLFALRLYEFIFTYRQR